MAVSAGFNIALDPFWWWRAALAGKKPHIYEAEPMVGYFKTRDRRGMNKDMATVKRPWIPAAIYIGGDGQLVGELAGRQVPIEWLWPDVSRHPIPYETYVYFHTHERWPEEAVSA